MANERSEDIAGLVWHKLSTDEAFRRLSSSPIQGLSTEQVARKSKEHGLNKLSPPPSRWFQKAIQYLFGGFGSILLVASILVFIAWKPLGQPPAVANLALAIVLAIVFVVQVFFAFFQGTFSSHLRKTCSFVADSDSDWSSSRVMASITNMLPDRVLVLRNGSQTQIDGTELVPGDVIKIKIGDKLPADIRLFEVSSDIKFDRAILTGKVFVMR